MRHEGATCDVVLEAEPAPDGGSIVWLVRGYHDFLALKAIGTKQLRHGQEFLWRGERLVSRDHEASRDGDVLCVPQGGVRLPMFCVKCGRPATTTLQRAFRRSLRWRIFYALTWGRRYRKQRAEAMKGHRGGPVPAGVPGFFIDHITLDVPVCEEHLSARNLMRATVVDAVEARFTGVSSGFLRHLPTAQEISSPVIVRDDN